VSATRVEIRSPPCALGKTEIAKELSLTTVETLLPVCAKLIAERSDRDLVRVTLSLGDRGPSVSDRDREAAAAELLGTQERASRT
jgi:hypothetical protein